MSKQAFFWLTLILSPWIVSPAPSSNYQRAITVIQGCPSEQDKKSGRELYSFSFGVFDAARILPIVYRIHICPSPPPECSCPTQVATRFGKPSVHRRTTSSTTQAPPTSTPGPNYLPPNNEELHPCIWAIVSCCSPDSETYRQKCFELFGCNGNFWDRPPCKEEVVLSAARTVVNYYSTNRTKDSN